MDNEKTLELRNRVRSYKERSHYTFKTIAEMIGIPYSSFRNFMYGSRISVERYEVILENIELMESRLPW